MSRTEQETPFLPILKAKQLQSRVRGDVEIKDEAWYSLRSLSCQDAHSVPRGILTIWPTAELWKHL